MATKRDPWKDWGKGILGLFNTGQGYSTETGKTYSTAQAAWPNPGTYDPAYDIQRDNAQLGQFRYGQDFARDWGELGAGATGGRNATDLQTALARAGQQKTWGNEDFDRSLSDLLTGRTRGTEDYQRNIAGLQRSYQRLGNNQSQQMRAAGVAQGGAAQQAAGKRAANMAFDRQPIDTGFNRFLADSQTQEGRIGENRQRFNTQSQWGVDDANLQYGRGREDAITDYGRTGTDLQNYLTGLSRLAYYTSGQIQPAGVSILELMRRRGTSP